MLSCANKSLPERYRSSLKGAGTAPFFLLVLISYFRFDHSYPDTTEFLLFLLFLLSPCSAFTVRSAYGCTTTQSAESDDAFLSHLGYHGIMDASLLANFFFSSFRNGIVAAGRLAFGNCSLVWSWVCCFLVCLVPFRGLLYCSVRLFPCFLPSIDIRKIISCLFNV